MLIGVYVRLRRCNSLVRLTVGEVAVVGEVGEVDRGFHQRFSTRNQPQHHGAA